MIATALGALAVLLAAAAPALAHPERHRTRENTPLVRTAAVPGLWTAAKPRIVGGAPVGPGGSPWMAFIADFVQDGSGEVLLCSGTVIAPSVILTAGHCVEDISTGQLRAASEFRVVTGDVDWSDTAGRQLSGVSRVAVYPGFNRFDGQDDAGILVLTQPTTAPAIALATSADGSLLSAGNAAAIEGWGLLDGAAAVGPTTLQYGVTTIQSAAYCAQQTTLDKLTYHSTSDICAYTGSTSACHGDSGGPLGSVRPDHTPVEIGIISHGDPDCDPAYPSIFSRVDRISSWAAQQVAALTQPPPAPAPAPTPTTTSAPPPTTTAAPAPDQPADTEQLPPCCAFSGLTSQHHAISFSLSDTAATITAFRATFTMRCAARRFGPYRIRAKWATAPLRMTRGLGVWRASRTFHDTGGWRYRLSVSLAAAGRATGTLTVRGRVKHHGMCTTGLERWSAA